MLRLILSILLVGSCAKQGSAPKEQVNPAMRLLSEKVNTYMKLLPSQQDVHGFILTDKCDSLIFSGLLSAAEPELNIDINQARKSPGEWMRRPSQDCGPEWGTSHSTISRDMILGLMWHLWRTKDLETAQELLSVTRERLYVLIGEGTPGELLMTPTLINTLARIVEALGGTDVLPVELHMPGIFPTTTGYVSHLAVWHILLRGEITGGISAHELSILEYHANRSPNNPLFQAAYAKYTDGDMGVAIGLLLNDLEWPSDRLPSTDEHCEPWPVQRDYEERDWGPCSPRKEHPGAEVIAIYNLVIK